MKQGYFEIRPIIKKIEFVQRGTFSLVLQDGRKVTVPLKAFPTIKKLNAKQRRHWYILDDVGFSFEECDEVFHIEQVLGDFREYKYTFLPQVRQCAETPNTFNVGKGKPRKAR